ncbi:MAG TPA: sigma-70 family RNA polymerase sigma factor [Edaphobacter sp.]|nr:sigma-70 family RNA polymerase sigma factor [Edaphobacter sp.]
MSSDATAFFPKSLADVADLQVERVHSPLAAADHLTIAEPTDEQLLSQVGLGSRDALGLLFRRHARAVFHVAWRILRDESEADDLRQEVFLYLSERSQNFDAEKGSGVSWIIQVTYHRAIDRRRYLDFRQHYSSEEFDEQRMPTAAVEPSPEALDGRAIRDHLREQLTADQQQTLELHFFEGYSLREIAERNGQTVGNVRHHYYRALERLRSHLFAKKRG